MANAAEISVAIESAIHDALTACVQNIFDQHGIRVTDLRSYWMDASSVGTDHWLITGVQIITESAPGRGGK